MKALWMAAAVLALLPTIAWTQDKAHVPWVQGPVTPPLDSRYSYIDIHHDGAQDKTPPALWLGTAGDGPPEPSGLTWGTLSTPWYADFRTARDHGQRIVSAGSDRHGGASLRRPGSPRLDRIDDQGVCGGPAAVLVLWKARLLGKFAADSAFVRLC